MKTFMKSIQHDVLINKYIKNAH